MHKMHNSNIGEPWKSIYNQNHQIIFENPKSYNIKSWKHCIKTMPLVRTKNKRIEHALYQDDDGKNLPR